MKTSITKSIPTTIKRKILQLTRELNTCNEQYYKNHISPISDLEYDQKLKQLAELEKKYKFRYQDSPTLKVGSDKSPGFQSVVHTVPMQSLANTYSEPELLQFVSYVQGLCEHCTFVTEYKIDGLSVSCVYKDGVLYQASTRGNGTEGDDITRNARFVYGIPDRLPFEHNGLPTPHLFEIRGEVFMSFDDFKETNKHRAKKGLEPLANPRNAASGTLKSLDVNVFRERKLHAVFYHVAQADELPETQEQMFYLFDKLNIPHAPFYLCKTQADVVKAIGKIAQMREVLAFPTDGAVVKLNEFADREKLGSTAKYPRWATAYKFSPNQVKTRLLDITIQVGRTGVLTPVAELQPVELDGSTVKRATLHNADMISKLDVRIGDVVLLEKAGEVIPHILCSVCHLSDSKPYILIEAIRGRCPVCGEPVVRRANEVAWRCVNGSCPARLTEQLSYAAGKQALDIDGLGATVARALVHNGLVHTFADLFTLPEYTFTHLYLSKDKMLGENGRKIYRGVQAAKEKDLSCWITALGISGVGSVVARSLASQYQTLSDFYENFAVKNPDSVVEQAIKAFLADDTMIASLLEKGINPTSITCVGSSLKDKTFVITGKLSVPRDRVESLIRGQGGTVVGSVSKNTSYLIQGEDDRESTKAKKAKELGIPVLDEQGLMQLLSN